MAKVELRGARELARAIDSLPGKLTEQEIKKGLRAGARVVQKRARQILKSKVSEESTGALAKSITVATVRGRIQLGFRKPTSRRAHITEFGTRRSKALPFLRPALDETGDDAIRAIAAQLTKSVTKIAAEVSGDFNRISKRVKRQL